MLNGNRKSNEHFILSQVRLGTTVCSLHEFILKKSNSQAVVEFTQYNRKYALQISSQFSSTKLCSPKLRQH